MIRKYRFWIILWVLLFIVTGFLAFGTGHGGRSSGSWHGWGHMGGWPHGYQSENAPGWHGMGPGIMGDEDTGYGWGMDSFRGMTSWLPQNMTGDQSEKAGMLLEEAEKSNRTLMQQRLDVQAKLQRLYTEDKRDWNAIKAAAMALADLHSQQMKTSIEMQQKIDGLLTDNQRRQMSRAWRAYH